MRHTSAAHTGDLGPDQGIDDLWTQYKSTGDLELRNRLVLHYSPIVKYVAGRVAVGLPASVDRNDLVSDGVFGLIDAIDKFDPDRGLQFQTYAVQRIRGAMVDALRGADWVPRSVRDKIRGIQDAQVRLEARLGRPPTEAEIATELSVPVATLRQTLGKASHANLMSLDQLEGPEASAKDAVDDPWDDDDPRAGVVDAVRDLTERDQILVALYYFEGFTLAEVGQVLGVSESRVSQLHTRVTLALRGKLESAV